jgi:hypothetical protein
MIIELQNEILMFLVPELVVLNLEILWDLGLQHSYLLV